MLAYQQQFIEFALKQNVLKFGQFELKSGRTSPYFFNAGLFNDGQSLAQLAGFYAQTLISEQVEDFMLFGPAYKGIPLAAATAMAFATEHHRNIRFAFNRKEVKDHGEGGQLVGAPLKGRVIIVDDVITAGISVTESIDIIKANQAQVAGVIIGLDRQEKTLDSQLSAAQKVSQTHQIPVYAVANMTLLIEFLKGNPQYHQHLDKMTEYRQQFGVTAR